MPTADAHSPFARKKRERGKVGREFFALLFFWSMFLGFRFRGPLKNPRGNKIKQSVGRFFARRFCLVRLFVFARPSPLGLPLVASRSTGDRRKTGNWKVVLFWGP
jgi:hypothetical protein